MTFELEALLLGAIGTTMSLVSIFMLKKRMSEVYQTIRHIELGHVKNTLDYPSQIPQQDSTTALPNTQIPVEEKKIETVPIQPQPKPDNSIEIGARLEGVQNEISRIRSMMLQ